MVMSYNKKVVTAIPPVIIAKVYTLIKLANTYSKEKKYPNAKMNGK